MVKPQHLSRRRYLQFSLRTLLIALTIFGVWFGWKCNQARIQRDAVRAIKEVGGIVRYAHESGGGPSSPKWLRDLVGEDFFVTVVGVSIEKATDDKVRRVADHLERLSSLNAVHATHSRLTDEGVKCLRNVTQVETLNLGGNELLTGASIEYISQLKNLRKLEMWHSKITDDDLDRLSELRNLESLEVSFTAITDRGLEAIAKLKRLKSLGLCTNAITDAGIEHLENLTSLEQLDLGETRVTDASVLGFIKLQKLKLLSVRQTGVTPTGCQQLKTALPKAKVSYP